MDTKTILYARAEPLSLFDWNMDLPSYVSDLSLFGCGSRSMISCTPTVLTFEQEVAIPKPIPVPIIVAGSSNQRRKHETFAVTMK